jgi:signal transduction histidine kinase
MSIRNKTLLGMALIFLFNLLLLGGYYQFYLRDEVSASMQNAQMQIEETTRRAAESIEQHGVDKIEAALSDPQFERFDFTVTDAQSGEVRYESHRLSGDLEFHSTAVAQLDRQMLLVESTRHFTLGAVRALSLVQQVITVEIVIIAVILVVMAVVMQTGLIRPLTELNQRMRDFRQGHRDNPPRRARRDELGQLANEFDRLTHALDEEKRMQEQIIASISHDIKTPLTSVMGYVERLLKGSVKDKARVRQYLQTIYDRAQSINDLVADFDGYLSSAQTLKFKPIRTEHLCGLLKAEYEDELAASGASLTVENHAESCEFFGDLGKLRRVFGNLIGNAVKHAYSDEPMKITLHCEKSGDSLRFTVSDNGIGVAPENLERIFEPFHTGNSSRGEGSGLGLSICRSIVKAHGGTIRAQNLCQGGFSVIFELPIENSPDNQPKICSPPNH